MNPQPFSRVPTGALDPTRRLRHMLAALLMGTGASAGALAANLAPTVALADPVPNAVFVGPATVGLSANAADADGTVARVQYFNGTTLIGSSSTAPFSVSWTKVAPGSYSVSARATDNLGAEAVSASRTVLVKPNLAPTVSLATPANHASLVFPVNIALSANAADSDGKVVLVQYFQGTTVLGRATVAPYAVSFYNAAVGNYTITAQATDDKGAVTVSAPVTVSVNVNQAPAVSISAPLANASFAGPASISFAAAASDRDGSIAKVQYYNGSLLLGTALSPPYAFTWSGVAAGSYSITARATDDKGGVATSVALPLTVTAGGNQAPRVSLTAPLANASFAAPASIALAASATDADGRVVKVDFYQGSTLVGSAASAPFAFNWTNVAAGSYSITARATDDKGALAISALVPVSVSAVGSAQQAYYIHADQIDTARLITDGAGQPVWQMDTEPFGANPPNENPGGRGAFTYNLRFPGQYFDRETGQHYNLYRDYDPQLGRYVQSDPIGLAGGGNTYAYAGSNPIHNVDPFGLEYSQIAEDIRKYTPCKCPNVPPAPPGADVDKNMCEARQHFKPSWFKNHMKAGGDWDYKKGTAGADRILRENYGNFNYGAVSASYGGIGLPVTFIRRYAGYYQQYGTPENYTPDMGVWWGKAPYGDRAIDQKYIQLGIDYARCGCGM